MLSALSSLRHGKIPFASSQPMLRYTALPAAQPDSFGLKHTSLRFGQGEDAGATTPASAASIDAPSAVAVAPPTPLQLLERLDTLAKACLVDVDAHPLKTGAAKIDTFCGAARFINDQMQKNDSKFLKDLAHDVGNVLAPLRNEAAIIQMKADAFGTEAQGKARLRKRLQSIATDVEIYKNGFKNPDADVTTVLSWVEKFQSESVPDHKRTTEEATKRRNPNEGCAVAYHYNRENLSTARTGLHALELYTAIINPITNVSKLDYGNRQKRVSLKAFIEKDFDSRAQNLRIIIDDNGPGMPGSYIAANKKRDRVVDGDAVHSTGYGLLRIRELIEGAGGQFEIEGRTAPDYPGPETGTTIKISMPLKPEEDVATAPGSGAEHEPPQ